MVHAQAPGVPAPDGRKTSKKNVSSSQTPGSSNNSRASLKGNNPFEAGNMVYFGTTTKKILMYRDLFARQKLVVPKMMTQKTCDALADKDGPDEEHEGCF